MSRLRNDYSHFMNRAQQKKQDKQERISRVSWELFTTHGYENVTTRQVSEAANIATGTLFLYASSKGELLVLAFEHALREASRAPSTLPEDPRDGFLLLFSGPLRLYAQHRNLARHFLVEVLRGQMGTATTSNIQQFMQTLTGILERAQAAGHLAKELDAGQAAKNFFGIYMMVLFDWLPSGRDLDAGIQQLQLAFELHWNGLVAR